MDADITEDIGRVVWVNLGERSYPIHVAPGLIGRTGELLREVAPDAGRCAVVTSPAVRLLHGAPLEMSLKAAAVEAELVLVPEGEEAKTWRAAGALLGELLGLGLDRRSVLLALGGGAVGDLTGFAAAVYMRGVRFVQVPTTLLAQIDSAIGGKTAVNHPRGKNLIGAFHQPSLVVSDQDLLRTLPREELASGLAEAVKYGVIADGGLFLMLEAGAGEKKGTDVEAFAEIVFRGSAAKARLVELDERDTKGLRAALNYGHTVGHALETLTRPRMRHGEAIAVGMRVAARVSELLGRLPAGDGERQRALLERLGLPTALPRVETPRLLDAMRLDKKSEGGALRLVLPSGIGRPPTIEAVPDPLITRALEDCRGG